MRRYYLSPLVQDARGRWGPSIKDSVVTQGGSLTVITSGFRANGSPQFADALCVVDVRDHSVIGALTGVTLLPDVNLDAKVGSIPQATKLAMRAALVGRGVPARFTDNADGFRDIIEGIAKEIMGNDGFSADAFDA